MVCEIDKELIKVGFTLDNGKNELGLYCYKMTYRYDKHMH